ncbi:hypothetical protein B0H14DRAFT_3157334 [Mycena olivaceomarginata]|nr:hypothetical protein B0H14DRAFT_3157334 [Mycena olivaceomarginata]
MHCNTAFRLVRRHPKSPLASTMPLFESASAFQITGGNYIDIAGDVNLHTTQLAISQDRDPLTGLEFGLAEGLGPQLLGLERNGRHRGSGRILPYHTSNRPRFLNALKKSSHPVHSGHTWSTHATFDPSLSISPSYSLEYQFNSQPSFEHISATGLGSYAFTSQGPSHGIDPHGLSSSHQFAPILDPNHIFPIYNTQTPLALPSSDHGAFSQETRFNESCHFPGMTVDACTSVPPRDVHSTPSINQPGPFGEPALLLPDDFGGDQSNFVPAMDGPPYGLPYGPKASSNGVTFIGGNVNHIKRQGESAGDAFHDSAERYPQPKCHPETRTELLETLFRWSHGKKEANPKWDKHLTNNIIWLYGPAGAGKSAVAQSLCQKLEAEGGLVEDEPSIPNRSLSIQLQRLIMEPSQSAFHAEGRTLTVIIDGLDECEGKDIQKEILGSIGRFALKQELPLRFIIASRPEPHIREVFTDVLAGIHCPININKSFEGVRRYLLSEFARIQREHCATMATVACPWPSPDIIDHLVEKSSGYFIYASTIIKYIDDKNHRPAKRLEVIVGLREPDLESPYAALDQLYTQILSEFIELNNSSSWRQEIYNWHYVDYTL